MAKKVKSKKLKVKSENIIPGGKLNNFLNNISEKIINFRKSKSFYIILIIAGLLLLAIYKKNWIIAASVNGEPVSNLELQMRLNQQFRNKTLDQMLNEKIILGEAAKNNITVSPGEVENKIAEIEKEYGGAATFDAILAQQGQTRSSLKQIIKLQLTVEKLYAKDATVSAQEINQFLEGSREQLQATDSAGQEKEASDIIRNQKLTQVIQEKFQELRSKAKIQIF